MGDRYGPGTRTLPNLPNRLERKIVSGPVNFKKVLPNAETPFFATPGAAGFDLSTAEDAYFYPGQRKLVSTGLVIQTPPGHMLFLTFRSSTPRKFGVTVMTGIVDEDFGGGDDIIKLQVLDLRSSSRPNMPIGSTMDNRKALLPAGSRIAQGIFVPITRTEFIEVEEMGDSRGGFGSTGH